MTLPEFIAEIETDFNIYADSGDIDRVKVKTLVINELKKFGNDILIDQEIALPIKNSTAKLPDNFRSLWVAIKCDPYYVECKDEDRDKLQTSYYWKKRVETGLQWNEDKQECEPGCDKIITEEVYYHDAHARFHYKNPTYLTLTKGFNKNLCAKGCINLRRGIRNTSPHEISITNGMLNTNFSTGVVYLWYKGFDQDENGDIIIPETWNAMLIDYLEWYVKYRIALDLIANNRNAQTLKELLPIYKQELTDAKIKAQREAKFSRINSGTFEALKNRNRAESLKYERSFPII